MILEEQSLEESVGHCGASRPLANDRDALGVPQIAEFGT